MISLNDYNKLRCPALSITLITIVLVSLLYLAIQNDLEPWIWLGLETPLNSKPGNLERFVFLSYLCGFFSTWLTYFLSEFHQYRIFQVRSLRRLLMEYDTTCSNDDTQYNEDLQNRKIESTMTWSSILAAVASLSLGQIAFIGRNLLFSNPNNPMPWGVWEKTLLVCGGVCAFIAYVFLLLTADSLDTAKNNFHNDMQKKLTTLFYRSTRHKKYYGLMLILLAMPFIAECFFPGLGSSFLGFLIAAGYRHWFPMIQEDLTNDEFSNQLCIFVIALILIIVPLSISLA